MFVSREQGEISEKIQNNLFSGDRCNTLYIPFLTLLSDGAEHTRQSCLAWFGDVFQISADDKKIVFESNSHPKWETVFDWVITKFRAKGLLENSSTAVFHITELGKELNELLSAYEYDGEKFFSALDKLRETRRNRQEDRPDQRRPDEEKHEEPAGASDDSGDSIATRRLTKKATLKDVRLLLGENQRTHEKYYWEFGNVFTLRYIRKNYLEVKKKWKYDKSTRLIIS